MTSELDYVPGLDATTDKALIIEQHRPVIGLSTWLLDAAVAAERGDRELQLMSTQDSRITDAVRTQLLTDGTRWIVKGPNAHYDGLTGAEVAWDGAQFAQVGGDDAPRLTQDWLAKPETVATSLQVVARVRYPAAESAVVGHSTAFLIENLAGAPPAGWGTEEPVSQLWNPEELTTFCRRWAPRSTLLTVTGTAPTQNNRPANGVIEIDVRPAGLEETTTIVVGQGGSSAPTPDDLLPVLREFTERFEVVSTLFLAAGTAPDTCTLPHYTGFPGPIGLVLGAEGRASLGPEATLALKSETALSIGDDTCLWFPVGTGNSPRDWVTFAALFRRITMATAKNSGKEQLAARAFRMPG
ncbi:MAG TPA: DUF6177 family protein [Kribbella sp.]|nr:DUF6177 family protein [Kribbella sp.]